MTKDLIELAKHTELIRQLEASAAVMPSDAAVAHAYKAAAAAIKEQAVEIERLRKDAALVAARERERMDKDAQRWAMAVQIINGVIFHPSRDDESDAANAYRLAAIRGCSFTESIDAAIRALNTEGEGNAV